MKIEKIICDRCGAEVQEKIYHNPGEALYSLYNVNCTPIGTFASMSPIDLCDECQGKLKEWFENV